METNKRSTRDNLEMNQHEHDEGLNAKRVVVVGQGELDLDVDTEKITEALTEAMKGFKIDMSNQPRTSEIKIVEIPTQVFVPQVETKIVEVPVVVKETQVIEVEKPILTESVKIVEVEKPITIEKYIEKTPAWAWALLITQVFTIGGLVYKILSSQGVI